MACINPNTQEFKEALILANGDPLLAELNINVKYQLKAVNALMSNKAVQLFNTLAKNRVTGDIFWNKVQQDLAIPKEQVELLKQYDTTDREQLITNMLADYSYAVEVNVAKNQQSHYYELRPDTIKPHKVVRLSNDLVEESFSTEEEAMDSLTNKYNSNTQHYSNLTVPGGTNYTENEIATPAITPSIKGHAQFATDKGIGWFRSDEVGTDKILNNQEDLDFPMFAGFDNEYRYKQGSKTRRILEVQSDLFQKGRDKNQLDKGNDWNTIMNIETNANKFLQLLNKGNNWVTFFIKSIIQDSAKKGYEKVLFPSGNTASKVEGHTTLEEFKKQKEDRIKFLQQEKEITLDKSNVNFFEDIKTKDFSIKNERGERIDYIKRDGVWVKQKLTNEGDFKQAKPTNEDVLNAYKDSLQYLNSVENIDNEINQLKQELERVEKEGFGALKPIFNFYENTVANTLKKQGYNPVQVTDEYGNTWNEVEITPEEGQQAVLLQKKGTETSTASPKTIALVNEFLKRIGVNVQKVKEIAVNGVKFDANGVADFLNQLIQIVEGKEEVALTEEAMHFAVEILEQTNPKLFAKLLKEINKYDVYQQVIRDYSSNPLYKTKDGKPDILKLKKEAIGKKLADMFVEKTQEDGLIKDNLFMRLWQEIKQFFADLFRSAGFNPFEEAIEQVLSGEMAPASVITTEGQMFQLEELSEKQKTFLGNLASKKPDKTEEGYSINGKPLKKRVTDFAKQFYDQVFRDRDITQSEKQKAINEIYADYGDAVHEDIKHIVENNTDESGRLLPDPKDDTNYVIKTDERVYKTLRTNVLKRMSLFPKGTIFLAEQMVQDGEDIGGTIDFLAITKEGKVSILDWKSMALNIEKFEDVPWYKKKAYRIQLAKYKQILQTNYGLKPSDIVKAEAIPIIVKYDYKKDADGDYVPIPRGISIGNAKTELITQDYFLPVSIETQSSGDPKLDALITKFRGLKESLEEKKVVTSLDRKRKAEQLNALERAVRHLQIKRSVEPLLAQAEMYTQEITELFDYYNATLKGKDFSTIDKTVLNEYGLKLSRAFDYIHLYTDLDNELGHLFTGELTEEEEKELDRIGKIVREARRLSAQINSINNEFGVSAAKTQKIKDLLKPEMVVDMIDRLWKATSKIPMRTLQTFYKFRQEAQNIMDFKTDEENRELLEIKKQYLEWANANGISSKELFNILTVKDKNVLIDQYKKEFYTKAKEALKAKDFEWIAQNVDIEAYREGLKNKLLKDKEYYTTKYYTGKDANAQRKKDIEKLTELYDLSSPESGGWFAHYYELIKHPVEEKWTSEEWKRLTAKGNEPAKKLYDWVIKVNQKADEAGYLPEGKYTSPRIFLPFVRKSLIDKLLSGGNPKLGESFLDSITIDENSYGYGTIDKVSNKLVNKIPIYFTSDPEVELSEDLFRNLALYNDYVNRYQQLSQIEGIALSLGRVEENKASIQTSFWGKPSFNAETEEFDLIQKNDKNADLYQKQIATLIYGQKDIQSERFDQALGKVNGITTGLNKFFGAKIFPENLQDKQLSLVKSLDTLNNFFQQSRLGLNILPALSNLAGGTANTIILAGKYFNKKDVVKSEFEISTKSFSGERGKLILAAIKYFMPFTDDMNRDLLKELSLKTISDESVQDALFWLMRKGDRLVQGTVFLANLRNQIMINGKVQNAREYLRNTDQYKNRYNTPEQIASLESSFEQQVEDLIEQYGLLKDAKVVNDELVIPGLQRNTENTYAIRNLTRELSKKVLGNMTTDEVRGTQQNAFLRSAMLFKNWIPNLADARFGGMKYNSAVDAYEWGRMRTMARYFAINGLRSFANLKAVIEASPKGMEQLNEMWEEKKKSYYKETGQELDMSAEEFYDLVRQNLRMAVKEAIITAHVVAMFWAVVAAAPPDDDQQAKNIHKFSVRLMDKVKDELLFFWWPAQTQQLLSGSLFPSMGVVNDGINIIKHIMLEVYGIAFDDKLEEQNKTIKYILKPFPILSQMGAYSPLFAPELAKDLGIEISKESRVRQ